MRDKNADYYSAFEEDHRTFGFSDHDTGKTSPKSGHPYLVATFAVLVIAASVIAIGSSVA
jgi:hypothetical protein